MSAIIDIIGREVLDSRGNPTVEAEVWLESCAACTACRRRRFCARSGSFRSFHRCA